jgi:hypothetical protein
MTLGDCPHGSDPYACRPCQRADDQGHAPHDVPTRPRPFAARFPGTCALCRTLILPGDMIAPVQAVDPDGGDDGYVCPDCLEELTP